MVDDILWQTLHTRVISTSQQRKVYRPRDLRLSGTEANYEAFFAGREVAFLAAVFLAAEDLLVEVLV